MVILYRSGGLEGTVASGGSAPEVAYHFDSIAVFNSLPAVRSNSVYFTPDFQEARHWCSQRIHYGGDPNIYSVEVDSPVYIYDVSVYNQFSNAYNSYKESLQNGRHAETSRWVKKMVSCVKLYHETKTLLKAHDSILPGKHYEALISKEAAASIKEWKLEYEPVLY